jgi:hypothetical protein
MADIQVDEERLGQLAEALSARSASAGAIRDALDSAVAGALGACGTLADGGLRQALQGFKSAWDYDVSAVGVDVRTTAAAMQSLAALYGQADAQGAQAMQ